MAIGDTLAAFFATDGIPLAANTATPDTRAGANDTRQEVLDFDTAVSESIDFSGVIPFTYSTANRIQVTIGWMASSGVASNVRWNAAFKSFTDDADDFDTKVFAAVQAVSGAAPSDGANPGEPSYDSIPFTNAQADAVQPGEFFRLRITRDVTHADDEMSGDAELIFVELREIAP
jgi:hypothetical protein